MLTLYLALGILGGTVAPASPIVTPPERTITLTKAGGRVVALQQLDPADVMDYQIDLSDLPDSSETLTAATFSVTGAAAGMGFQIRLANPYAPVQIDSTTLRIWVSILPGNQSDATWSTVQNCAFDVDVSTNSTPPRHYQRSGAIPVVQK